MRPSEFLGDPKNFSLDTHRMASESPKLFIEDPRFSLGSLIKSVESPIGHEMSVGVSDERGSSIVL